MSSNFEYMQNDIRVIFPDNLEIIEYVSEDFLGCVNPDSSNSWDAMLMIMEKK